MEDDRIAKIIEETEKLAGHPIKSLGEALMYHAEQGANLIAAKLVEMRLEANELASALNAHPDWELDDDGRFWCTSDAASEDTPEKLLKWYLRRTIN